MPTVEKQDNTVFIIFVILAIVIAFLIYITNPKRSTSKSTQHSPLPIEHETVVESHGVEDELLGDNIIPQGVDLQLPQTVSANA